MELTLEWQQVLGSIAVALGLLGYVFYIHGIIKGKVKPHFFSWFVWMLLTAIAFVAQVVEGGGPGAWVTGITAAMSLVFVIVGLGSSSRTLIAKTDWFYFIAALLAIPPWYFTGDPLGSVIIITVIDAVAFAPTFRKAYYHPDTENAWTFALSGIKFVFGLAALSTFSITTALYPASLVLANGAFVAMLIWRRSQLKRAAMSNEIERKFYVKELPDMSGTSSQHYERHFLKNSGEEEERISKIDDRYYYEKKKAISALERTREKKEISADEFEELKKSAIGSLSRERFDLSKTPKVSVQVYHGKHEGLVRAEVEFSSKEEAVAFEPFSWMGEEMTGLPIARDARLVELREEEFRTYLSDSDTSKNGTSSGD